MVFVNLRLWSSNFILFEKQFIRLKGASIHSDNWPGGLLNNLPDYSDQRAAGNLSGQ